MLETSISKILALSAALAVAGISLSTCMKTEQDVSSAKKAVVTTQKAISYSTEAIEARLKIVDPAIKVESINQTPIKGLIEITMVGGQSTYANEDASYLLNGKIFHLTDAGLVDLSALKQQETAIKVLQGTSADEMIIYAPKNPRAFITVFTDIDCAYCHKLHAQIPGLNALGIGVRYMAFPRMGVDSDTGKRMESVWCAPDRKAAMDLAMSREPIDRASCESPVKSHFEKGHLIGVSGTPTIIFSDGSVKPGYSEARDIVKAAIDVASTKTASPEIKQ
jgi:thiol:disulfide interchange protein DsbC